MKENKTSIPVPATRKPACRAGFRKGKTAKRPNGRPARSVERNILLKEFKEKKAFEMLSSYRPAVLYKGPSYWYIYYYYQIPGSTNYQRFKEYFDINTIRDKKDKLIYGKEAVDFMNKKLAEGFNPFKAMQKKTAYSSPALLQSLYFVVDVLNEHATVPMRQTHNCMLGRFERFIENYDMGNWLMWQADIDTANLFREFLLQEQLAKKTINATLSYMGLFWDAAIRMKKAVSNPFRSVEKVKKDRKPIEENDEDLFEPISEEEMVIILEHLNNNNQRNFLRYLAMIYCAWARPVEVCRLLVEDINLKDEVIRFKKGQTKNDKGAYVQIIPPLKKLLLEMNLHRYSKKWHLFSTIDYLPGPKMKDPQRPLDKWTSIVVEKLHIDKRMYALKHTGNIEYLLRNKGKIDVKWQQMQNRHSSVAMTERYIRKLGAYFIECADLKFRDI